MSLTSTDAGVVLDELGVALVEVVAVEPDTVVLVMTVLDVVVLDVAVLDIAVLDVAAVLDVTVMAGTVIGTAFNTGAATQLAIVSDVQSLTNKLLMRPNSL
jgi:hypothetical protein